MSVEDLTDSQVYFYSWANGTWGREAQRISWLLVMSCWLSLLAMGQHSLSLADSSRRQTQYAQLNSASADIAHFH